MYIHNYQIQNVLNVYRKQLSQSPGVSASKPSTSTSVKDRVTIAANGQKQTVFDKISTEIVDRIAQFGPENKFKGILAENLTSTAKEHNEKSSQKETEFTYTLIDEQNRKMTNTLPVEKLNPFFNHAETHELSEKAKAAGIDHLADSARIGNNHKEKEI